jgi:hypothetical protein
LSRVSPPPRESFKSLTSPTIIDNNVGIRVSTQSGERTLRNNWLLTLRYNTRDGALSVSSVVLGDVGGGLVDRVGNGDGRVGHCDVVLEVECGLVCLLCMCEEVCREEMRRCDATVGSITNSLVRLYTLR